MKSDLVAVMLRPSHLVGVVVQHAHRVQHKVAALPFLAHVAAALQKPPLPQYHDYASLGLLALFDQRLPGGNVG